MSLLCKCIRLTLIAEVKDDVGGAEGTWDVTDNKHATYTVELLEGEGCGGSAAIQSSLLSLKMNGCGRLRINVTGQGSLSNKTPQVAAFRATPESMFLSMEGEGGETPSCGTGDLVLLTGDNPAEFDVCCGQTIYLQVISNDNSNTAHLTVEFAVEVIG